MDGYAPLKARATRFLRENPEVQAVTIVRPRRSRKRSYDNGHDECYGRLPETCDRVQAILRKHLPNGLEIRPKRSRDSNRMADREKIDVETLRDTIFNALHSEITSKFREHLVEVCEHKHSLLATIAQVKRILDDMVDETATSLPVEPDESENKNDVAIEVEDI